MVVLRYSQSIHSGQKCLTERGSRQSIKDVLYTTFNSETLSSLLHYGAVALAIKLGANGLSYKPGIIINLTVMIKYIKQVTLLLGNVSCTTSAKFYIYINLRD